MTSRRHEDEIEDDDDEEVLFQGSESAPPASPSKAAPSLGKSAPSLSSTNLITATPSNTPVTTLFPKSFAAGNTGVKRAFEHISEGDETKQIAEALGGLHMANKEASPAPPTTLDLNDDDDEEEEAQEEEDDEEEEEEEEDDYVATLAERQAALPGLKKVQDEVWILEAQYLQERYELDLKFQGLRAPLLAQRKNLVSGANDKTMPPLPGFWLDAMMHNSVLSHFIEEYDMVVLTALLDVDITNFKAEGKFGFTLTFTFAKDNKHFTNTTLTKTCYVNKLFTNSQAYVERSTGTKINWLPGKKLTVGIEETSVKPARGGKKRGGAKPLVVRKEVPRPSFFCFFDNREDISDEQANKMSPQEVQMYSELRYQDDVCAFTLRNKVAPMAVDWYTGEAEDSDDDDDEEDEEGEEEDDDDDDDDDERPNKPKVTITQEDDDDEDVAEDDDDDDDDEEDDDDDKPAVKVPAGGKTLKSKSQATKPATKNSGGASDATPECKQQ